MNANDGSPLERARVSIANVENSAQTLHSIITATDGRFVFDQLAPGKYSIYGAKRGFMDGGYDQHGQFSTAIVTGAGLETENLTLRLSPAAMMTVKVIDEAGDPVRKARVTVFRDVNFLGRGRTLPTSNQQADDLGICEIRSLSPGNYFVSAAAAPWYAVHPPSANNASGAAVPVSVDRALDVAYLTTFYPDATDPDAASPIPVKSGDRVDVEIHLNPVPALHLQFHLPQVNGGAAFPSFQQQTLYGDEFVQPGGMQNLGGDLYEISGMPAGKYKVRMNTPGQPPKTSELSLTTNGQEFDPSAGESAGSMKATVALADGSKLPPQMEVILMIDSLRNSAAQGSLNEKGEVTFKDLDPGEYTFAVRSPSSAYYVTKIVGDGAEAAGHTLRIASGTQRSVSLVVAAGTGRIKGFVKHDGLAAAGAMVVLVPKDTESDVMLFRRDQSDLDGSFDMRGVVPGSYKIVAIDNGWDLEWSKPSVISHYLGLASAVTVTESRGQAMKLAAAVKLQRR